jgi:hypothetical protein
MTRSERSPAPDPGSLRVSGRRGWDQHPGVRTGRRLGPGERAADVVGRIAGSWLYLTAVIVAVLVGVAIALPRGNLAGGLAALAALASVEVFLVLMAARRAERIAMELALYHLDQARRAAAIAEDLRGEMQRLHADVARIAAHTEKASYPVRRP